MISENRPVTPKDTEEALTLRSTAFVICPRDPVHCERSSANPATCQASSIEGSAALSHWVHIVVISSCPRGLRQEDGSVRKSQARCRFTGPPAARWVVEGVINTLRTGSQTKVDGRVPKALLEVIGTLLDNSALFIEPCVSHLTYRFAFANATTSSCTSSYPQYCLFCHIHRYRCSHTRNIRAPQRRNGVTSHYSIPRHIL